jgi:hypothetical protein
MFLFFSWLQPYFFFPFSTQLREFENHHSKNFDYCMVLETRHGAKKLAREKCESCYILMVEQMKDWKAA